jgi:hypothetical protein
MMSHHTPAVDNDLWLEVITLIGLFTRSAHVQNYIMCVCVCIYVCMCAYTCVSANQYEIMTSNVILVHQLYRFPALNDNKIKHCTHSTIKCIGEMDTFSNTGPHKAPYVLSTSQSDTISGTTHFKTIYSSWTGTHEHFIGNALCSFDDSVTQIFRDKQRPI